MADPKLGVMQFLVRRKTGFAVNIQRPMHPKWDAVQNHALAGLWQDLCAMRWADRAEGNGAAEENLTAQSGMR